MNIVERFIINNNNLNVGNLVMIHSFADPFRKKSYKESGMNVGSIFKVVNIEKCHNTDCRSSVCMPPYSIEAVSIDEFNHYAYSCSCKFIKLKE